MSQCAFYDDVKHKGGLGDLVLFQKRIIRQRRILFNWRGIKTDVALLKKKINPSAPAEFSPQHNMHGDIKHEIQVNLVNGQQMGG